jgi:ATP-binding cassette subfamily B protein
MNRVLELTANLQGMPRFGAMRARVLRVLDTIRRARALLGEVDRRAFRRLLVWNLADGAATIFLPIVTLRLIESISQAQRSHDVRPSVFWLGVEVLVGLFRAVTSSTIAFHCQAIAERARTLLNGKLMLTACGVPFARFEQESFVSEVTRMGESTGEAAPFLLDLLAIGRGLVVIVGCSALLSLASPWLIPFVALAAVPRFLLDLKIARDAFGLEAENAVQNRKRWHMEWLLTAEMSAKDIRTLGARSWLVEMYRDICGSVTASHLALSAKYRWRTLAFGQLNVLTQYGPHAYVLLETVQGRLTLGMMLLVMIAFPTCSGALGQVLGASAALLARQRRLEGVFDFIDQAQEPTEALAPGEALLEAAPELVLEDVWFSYPGAAEPVLRGVNLTVRAGERIALAGVNGAGKTTLVKIILGLYQPQRGRVLLGGVHLSECSTAWKRKNIGVIFQDFSRFQFSIQENVALGWLDDAQNEERIWDALEKADAAQLVRGLPGGLKSALGPSFGGRDVSGGQWQRLALARLFMHRGRFWVLDEPSAAMDPETEERTFRRFRQWTTDRTSITISHRLSTVLMADRIAILEDGQVVDIGTHAELRARGGRYAELFPGLANSDDDAAASETGPVLRSGGAITQNLDGRRAGHAWGLDDG